MKNVISVVGAGGKTTVVNLMAKNISKRCNVLVSTTTKMKLPTINQYDVLVINKNDFEKYKAYFLKSNKMMNNAEFFSCIDDLHEKFIQNNIEKTDIIKENRGIFFDKIHENYLFLGNRIKILKNLQKKKYSFNQKKIKKYFSGLFYYKKFRIFYLLPQVEINANNKKFMHIKDEEIQLFTNIFDYIILESDGARKKRLKLPKNHEPVISKLTTHTIAVIDIKMTGEKISQENTYNTYAFKTLLNKDIGDILSINDFIDMISLKDGIFKGSHGEKSLCINKVETKTDEENAKYIKSQVTNQISTIILRKFP